MSANPKRRRPTRRTGSTRAQLPKAPAPQLVLSANGELVPAHKVTAANPSYKGKLFINVKK